MADKQQPPDSSGSFPLSRAACHLIMGD